MVGETFEYIASFVVSGMVTGSLYALAAFGIVIVYRATRVLNFAHGAIGVSAAFIMLALVRAGLPVWCAFITAVLFGGVCGICVMYTLAPVPKHMTLSRVMITTGWLLTLNNLMVLLFGRESKQVPALFPTETIRIGQVNIGFDQIGMLVTAVLVCAAGYLAIQKTGFGRSLRAVSENPGFAESLGINSGKITAFAWAASGGTAAVSVIMAARFMSLETEFITGTVNFIGIAGCMMGGLFSLPMTFAGGILIGVTQALVQIAPGNLYIFRIIYHGIPFLIVFIALTRKKERHDDPGYTKQAADLRFMVLANVPAAGGGRFSGSGRSAGGGIRIGTLLAIVVVAVMPFLLNSYWLSVATSGIIMSVAMLSLVVLTGFLGQISFAQGAFMGIGAYTFALLTCQYHWQFLPAAALALALTILFSMLIAVPAFRIRGLYLAIVTYTLQALLDRTLFLNRWYTGGNLGYRVNRPALPFLDFRNETAWYYFVAVTAALVFIFVRNLPGTALGRNLRAVREGEGKAPSLGIPVERTKLIGFGLSALIAGMAGILLALQSTSVVAGRQYNGGTSLSLLVLAVLLGIRSPVGALIAGILCELPTALVSHWFPSSIAAPKWIAVVSGLALILNLLQFPNGLSQMAAVSRAQGFEKKLKKRASVKSPGAGGPAGTEPMCQRSDGQ